MRELLTRLSKMTAGYGLVQWAGPLLSLIFTPIIMRALGPSGYGVAEYLLTCASALSTLALFALPTALQSHYNDRQDVTWKAQLVGSALILGLAFALIVGLPVAFFAESAAELLGIPAGYAWLLRWIGALMWTSVLAAIFTLAAQSALRVRWGMILSIVTIGVVLTGNLLFVVALQWGATGLVATQLLLGLASCLTGFVLTRSLVGKPTLASTRKLLISAGTLFPTMGAAWVLSVADRFFLVRVVSVTELGYYATAVKLASLLFVLMSPLYSAWIPLALAGQHDPGARERYPTVARYLAALALVGSLGLALLSTELLLVLGLGDYTPASQYVGLLTYPHVFAAINVPLTVNQMMKGRLGVLSGSVVVGAVINMALNALLIPPYGVWGAVIATVIGYGVPVAIVFLNSRRSSGVPYPMRIVLLAGAAQFGLLVLWIVMPPLPALLRVGLKSLTLIVFVGWCFVTGLAQPREFQQVKSLVLSRIRAINPV